MREIEVSTLEENPQLFREYLSATPADRSVMDNQFKNMKTHARHLSKVMWYEWRMKLLEGLREVLVTEGEGLKSDSVLLREQEQILEESLPELLNQHEQLSEEYDELQQRAEELSDCDQDEIAQARQQLVATDQEVRTKRERIAALKKHSQELDKTIEDGHDVKIENQQAIQEAQRMKEEYRGWSTAEVSEIKGERNNNIILWCDNADINSQNESMHSKQNTTGLSPVQPHRASQWSTATRSSSTSTSLLFHQLLHQQTRSRDRMPRSAFPTSQNKQHASRYL